LHTRVVRGRGASVTGNRRETANLSLPGPQGLVSASRDSRHARRPAPVPRPADPAAHVPAAAAAGEARAWGATARRCAVTVDMATSTSEFG
jgi:hypothetical protein